MKCHISRIVALILTLVVPAFGYQDNVKTAFAFKPDQSVYVVALKSNGTPDLAVERKLKEEFEKQKFFKVAKSLSSADLVFLMYVEYEYNQATVGGIGVGSEDIKSVSAFAVLPATYTQSKTNIDNLRDEALWQHDQNNNHLRTSGLPKNVAKKFHDKVAKK